MSIGCYRSSIDIDGCIIFDPGRSGGIFIEDSAGVRISNTDVIESSTSSVNIHNSQGDLRNVRSLGSRQHGYDLGGQFSKIEMKNCSSYYALLNGINVRP